MTTNKTSEKVLYLELSYVITGILFSTHNELGLYAKEKQYGNLIEKKLKEINLDFTREKNIGDEGNILDFIIENKIVLEIKATRKITSEHFRQIQNYLQQSKLKLGLLVNFRDKYVNVLRIIRIDSYKN